MTTESLLETATMTSPKATEIFHCESVASKVPGLKRKLCESEREREGGRGKISSLISPPLFKPRPNLAMVPGYPHEAATQNGTREQEAGPSQEDEWKNIKVVRLEITERQYNDRSPLSRC